MSEHKHGSPGRGEGFNRAAPGPLDPAGERLWPRLVVVAVLGLGLVAASELSDDSRRQAYLPRVETPQAAGPPPLIFGERSRRDLAAR